MSKVNFNHQEAESDLQWFGDANGLEIESKAYHFDIYARPYYCDRGRFIVYAESKNELWNPFDSADGFPRYYFSLQRCLDELKDLIEFRERDINFTSPQKKQLIL